MKNKNYKIPKSVIDWTDKYFHQSAFDVPLRFPGKRVIGFLIKFRKEEKIKLYRGVNKYNEKNYTGVKSWTYDKEIAGNYRAEGGKIVEKVLSPSEVLLDTTLLSNEHKKLLGYDYKIDDMEVLIISNNN